MKSKNSFVIRLIITFTIFFLYSPIVSLIIYSFNSSKSKVWNGFTLKWYIQLINNQEIMTALYNSLLIAVIASIISVIIGTIAALYIFTYKYKLKSTIMNIT